MLESFDARALGLTLLIEGAKRPPRGGWLLHGTTIMAATFNSEHSPTQKKSEPKGSRIQYQWESDSIPGALWARPKGADLPAWVIPPEGGMPEPRAVEDLLRFGRARTLQGLAPSRLAGMSDLHPGSTIPVGSVIGTPEGMGLPQAIGGDINCGMRLARFELSHPLDETRLRRIRKALRAPLLEGRRDIPLRGEHFRALFDEGPLSLLEMSLPKEGLWRRWSLDSWRQAASRTPALEKFKGSSRGMPEPLLADRLIRDPALGTLGRGNHFFELQAVEARVDKSACWRWGIQESGSHLWAMIHTGSRDVGQFVGSVWASRAKSAWESARVKAPEGIWAIEGEMAAEWMGMQAAAARWAWLNRMCLQEMARQAIEDELGEEVSVFCAADCSHNVALPESGMWVHRKGACQALAGELALIPGSMGDRSWIVEGAGAERSMGSCSHGAGRAHRRLSAASREGVSKLPFEVETLDGRRVIEEAPWMYRDVDAGVAAQAEAGLIHPIASMRPIATFKA